MKFEEFNIILNSLGFQKQKEYTDTNGSYDRIYTFDLSRFTDTISVTLDKNNNIRIWSYGVPMTIHSDSRGEIVMSREMLIKDIDKAFTMPNVTELEKKYYFEKRKPFVRDIKLGELGI